jgi:ATP-binding cassette, subfamily B, bacterial PglK
MIMEPSIVFDNQWLFFAYNLFSFESVHVFTIFSGLVMFTIIVLANLISAFATWIKIRLSLMNNHRLSKRLLEKYLAMPYTFFLNQNSSELSKNVLAEVDHLTNDYIIPLLEVVTKALLVLAILLILFWVDIFVSLVAMLLIGGIYALIYWRVNHKLKHLGFKRWEANEKRYKSTYEVFGGIKEIKAMNRESYFLNIYSLASHKHASYKSRSKVIGLLPRFALEAIAFGGIILYSLILLLTQEDARQVIPLAGFFAFAGYRLMPAVQDIFNSFTTMRYSQPVLDKIYRDITISAPPEQPKNLITDNLPEPLICKDSIRLDRVSYSYPNIRYPTINEVDLTIGYNTSIAFVGPTGAGKTTLVDIILGLLRPQKGTLIVDDQVIDETNLKSWQANLGYVPQHIYLSDDTVARNIAFGIPDEKIDFEALELASTLANINSFIMNELPDGFDTVIGERGIRLSGGQRQRIGIARSLYHNPAVLIFDEATSALDGITEEAILVAMQNIAKLKTLIIIAHRLTTVKNCDMVYIIDRGKIMGQGTYEELLGSNKQFQAMAKAR